jgi:hypothetical protein
MELAKRPVSVEQPRPLRDSPVVRLEDTICESSTVDRDVARAWELKADLQWVRNDSGPINGFRWFLWGKFGLGRPPSGVEQRPTRGGPTVLRHEAAPIAPTLHLVTSECGTSRDIRSIVGPTPLDV